MHPVKQLISEGYCLHEEAVQEAYPNETYQELQSILLQADFRKNSLLRPYFAADINTCDATLQGPAVLQVTAVANITQPSKRQNEDNKPRLLRIKVTDGHVSATAIEFESILALSAHTVPGTKLLLQGSIRVVNGKILLTKENCRILGGRVDHLFEAWQANRSTYNQRKKNKDKASAGEGAPPKFEIAIARAVIAAANSAAVLQSGIHATDSTNKKSAKSSGNDRKKGDSKKKRSGSKEKQQSTSAEPMHDGLQLESQKRSDRKTNPGKKDTRNAAHSAVSADRSSTTQHPKKHSDEKPKSQQRTRDNRTRDDIRKREDRRPHSADVAGAAASMKDLQLSETKEAWPSLGADPSPAQQEQQAAKRMISSALGLKPRSQAKEPREQSQEKREKGKRGRRGRETPEAPKGMSLGDFI